jgi:glucose-6-phosphate dehydrogenase assembly protein OpcA
VNSVPLADADRALGELWAASSRPDAHACLFTLVALCATPDELPRARAALPSLALAHPCRTLSVACYPGEAPSIAARVGLHVDTRQGREPVGDDVDLDVRGEARQWVPDTVARLRAEAVPLYLWWVGDLPDDDRLFDRLVEAADVAVVHTADMDLRDLEALARLLALADGQYVLADLTWLRLRTWQEFTARFFDDPAGRAHLAALREVTLALCPRERAPEAASTQAALFAGWLCEALRWDTREPRWAGAGSERVATLRGPQGEEVTVRFVTVDRAGVYPGAIESVTLRGPAARFEVARGDDPYVLCWSAEAAGVQSPAQCVRIHPPEEPRMLIRALERPRRDPLFERSLAAAARLVAPVAARPA